MKTKNIVYWLPRVLAILFILFLALFSFDVFSMEGTIFQKTGGFLIHNIPVFILIFLLVFSWKYEKLGGLLFILAAIVFTFFFHTYQRTDIFLLISFPLLLTGLLFFLSGQKDKGV